jgi:hypothetical protein
LKQMTRVIIICEGETEQEFCRKGLGTHFAALGISIQPPLIKKSMGGLVKWINLRSEILRHLKADTTAYVSTLIDYYGIRSKDGFPRWDEAAKHLNKSPRMEILERGMAEDIDESLRHRYIPYLQLHEFESLLFSNKAVFYEQIPSDDLVGKEELEKIFRQYENPEEINDNRETCPSRRLAKIILNYNKIV